jgi:hypothetical protein
MDGKFRVKAAAVARRGELLCAPKRLPDQSMAAVSTLDVGGRAKLFRLRIGCDYRQ